MSVYVFEAWPQPSTNVIKSHDLYSILKSPSFTDAPKVVPETKSTITVTYSSASAVLSDAAFTTDPKELEEARKNLTARVCESPSVDAYAHVDIKCMEQSPTAIWWRQYLAKGGKQEDLIAHIGE